MYAQRYIDDNYININSLSFLLSACLTRRLLSWALSLHGLFILCIKWGLSTRTLLEKFLGVTTSCLDAVYLDS